MIAFQCPQCGIKYRVETELGGKKGKCPQCGKAVGIPPATTEVLPRKVGGPVSRPPQEDQGRTLPPRPSLAQDATMPPVGPSVATRRVSNSGARASVPPNQANLCELLAPAQATDELGRLGNYRILRLLGAGGMGAVFEAEDVLLKRRVALKVLLPALAANPSAHQRFLREARSAAAMDHDHIVHIYQVGEENGVPFLAMQLLPGESLDARLTRERRLAPAETMRLGKEMAEGLAAAHEKGLVHRDIKPANVWLEGKRGRVKLLDFGLARATDDEAHLTQTGSVIGTPAYMAPEQARGEPCDARTDLFGLGCVLYQLLTGEMPFRGTDTISTLMSVVNDEPRPIRQVNPAVPPALANLVTRLLAKPADDRPASAQAVADELQALADTSRPSSLRATLGAGLVALLAVVVFVGFWFGFAHFANWGDLPPRPPEEPARPPLTPQALVTWPAPIPGVQSWGLETRAHLGSVTAAAHSGDGSRLATGGADGSVRLWAAADGKLQHLLLGQPGAVTSLAWSPDGSTLAVGNSNGAVRLRNATSGIDRFSLEDHKGASNVLAWSSDGAFLASGSANGFVRLWDASTGSLVRDLTLKTPRGPITALSWRSDGKAVLAQIGERNHCLWEASSGKLLDDFTTQGSSSRWANSTLVVAHDTKGTVTFHNLGGGLADRKLSLAKHDKGIGQIALSADGKMLATSSGPQLRLWDAKTGAALGLWLSPRKAAPALDIEALAFSPDGKWLSAHFTSDSGLWIWKIDRAAKTVARDERWSRVGKECEGPRWSPDSKHVFASADGTFKLLAPADGKGWLVPVLPANEDVAWSPDGKSLAASTGNKGWQVRVWGLEPTQLRVSFTLTQTSKGLRHPIAWSGDGKKLVTAAGSTKAEVWDATTGKALRTLANKHKSRITALNWSPQSEEICTFQGGGWLWNARTGVPLRSLSGVPQFVAESVWSPDGKTLAVAGIKVPGVGLWDIATGKRRQTLTGHAGRVTALAWSADGQRLASGSADKTVRIWDATGAPKEALSNKEHLGEVEALAWLPDGQSLAVLSSGSKVCVWDLPSARVRATSAAWSPKARFSRDGRFLASTHDQTGVRIWETVSGKPRGTLMALDLAVSAEGHYWSGAAKADEIVYVVRTDAGEEMLTPEEMGRRFEWKNDPEKVRLTD